MIAKRIQGEGKSVHRPRVRSQGREGLQLAWIFRNRTAVEAHLGYRECFGHRMLESLQPQ